MQRYISSKVNRNTNLNINFISVYKSCVIQINNIFPTIFFFIAIILNLSCTRIINLQQLKQIIDE